jgi:type I restriction enzyme S subunit
MRSGYKKIGEFIELVDERNSDLQVSVLLGLSITKEFIPSVANTVGTDMANYKIIRRGQFACSIMQVRRDKKMPVALLTDYEEAIISQAYPVFRIVDESALLPEYLMMWMRRSEFDRHACFLAVGGVRGSLEWEDFLTMELPVPSIEKQREIVKEYNTIVNRINLNEQLNQKLEETAQALYKHWFVDFEFPISAEYAASISKPELVGKPYKSSGGEMVYNGELDKDIPEGWRLGRLGDLSTQFAGYAFKGDKYSFTTGVTVLRGENVTEKKLRWDSHKKWNLQIDSRMKKVLLQEFDLVIGMDGSKVGKNWACISKYDLPLLLAQRVTCVRATNKAISLYLFISLMILKFEEYVGQVQTGTSVPHISGQQIVDFPILNPHEYYIDQFGLLVHPLYNSLSLNIQFTKKLLELKEVLLQRMSSSENAVLLETA